MVIFEYQSAEGFDRSKLEPYTGKQGIFLQRLLICIIKVMRLSRACIRVGEHTARPEMKAPGSEDDVRSRRPYGAQRNITKYRQSFRFFFFSENLNSLHTFLVSKKEGN